MADTAQIVKGEDRVLTLSVREKKKEGDPFNLTGWTKISVEFRKNDGNILAKDTVPVGGVKAFKSHTDGGSVTVIFTAVNLGTLGNSIALVFDGVDDVDTVIAAWNGANPGNTVASDGVGTEVLPAATITLDGGLENVTYVTVLGDALLGKVQVELTDTDTNLIRLGKSQSVRMKIDKSEIRRIAIFRNAIDVVNPEF